MARKKEVIVANDLTKVYQMGEVQVNALCGVSVHIRRGEVVSIMGPSGSGKSTLMNIIGCLDRPTAGEYYLDGELVSDLSDDQLAAVRNQKVGFVFQNFNLLSRSTALVNVELPLRYAGIREGRREKAVQALEAVGLGDRVNHRPTELSGGQQQRVALARAIINNPAIIMADEPTGNLDSRTSQDVLGLLKVTSQKFVQTIVMITHNEEIAQLADRIIRIEDGLIVAR